MQFFFLPPDWVVWCLCAFASPYQTRADADEAEQLRNHETRAFYASEPFTLPMWANGPRLRC